MSDPEVPSPADPERPTVPLAGSAWLPPSAQRSTSGYPPPFELAAPGGPPPARSSRAVLVAILAVFALGAAAFGVAQVLSAGDGGFDSPNAAVGAFVDALGKGDGLGMLETLAPGERRPLLFDVQGYASELTRLGIIKKTDLNAVPGVNVDASAVMMADSQPIVPGFDRVKVSGQLTTSVDGSKVPVGDALRSLIEKVSGHPFKIDDVDPHSTKVDLQVVTVKVDGRYYVSLFGTIAENARISAGSPDLDPGKVIAPVGGANPQEAVGKLLDAAAGLDAAGVIAMLPPDEMASLQLYGQLLVDQADQSARRARSEGLKIGFSDLQYSVSDAGDGAKVVVPTSGTVHVQASRGDSFDISFHDRCFTVDGTALGDLPFTTGKEVCGAKASDLTDSLHGDLGADEASQLQAFLDRAQGAKIGIVVVPVGGKWFVSPLRTLADPALTLLKILQPADLKAGGLFFRFLDDAKTSFGESTLPDPGTAFSGGSPFGDRTHSTDPSSDGTGPTGSIDECISSLPAFSGGSDFTRLPDFSDFSDFQSCIDATGSAAPGGSGDGTPRSGGTTTIAPPKQKPKPPKADASPAPPSATASGED